MYYFLRENLFEDLNTMDITGHTEETGQYLWTQGAKFPAPIPPQTLELNPDYGERLPDLFDTTIPLFSDRLLKALVEAGVDNFDAYPMILRRPDTDEEWRNYSAVNFIGSIDAIDREKSDCRTSSIGELECESITINPVAAGDAICFRLQEGPDLLVIHERVAKVLEKYDFISVLIQKTEDYDGD
jgi:hypothetical protein